MARLATLLFILALFCTLAAGQAAKADKAPAAKGGVVYIPAADVNKSFEKPGEKLLDRGSYSVMVFSRTGPGESELHDLDTDIFYIVEGSATFMTGGKIVGARKTAPGEVRGKSIEGGQAHKLSKGDVIVIPKNTPHWYSEVNGRLKYYIVKLR